jgi:hypothetical protein
MASDDPEQFFAERRFDLSFHEEGGVVWADLVARPRLSLPLGKPFMVERYGRGTDRTSAAQRAVERWRSEQAT